MTCEYCSHINRQVDVDIATHIDIYNDGPERRYDFSYLVQYSWNCKEQICSFVIIQRNSDCPTRSNIRMIAFALFCLNTLMKNTLPTCIAVLSATDVQCFPCLTHCYYFISGNAGLFKNSYPTIPRLFDLLCFPVSAYLWWKQQIVQGYLLILSRSSLTST